MSKKDLIPFGGRKPVYLLLTIGADYPTKIAEFTEGWKDEQVVEVAIVHGGQAVEMSMREFMQKVGLTPEFSNERETK